MTNLLSANLSRLFKNKALWLVCLVTLVSSLFWAWDSAKTATLESLTEPELFAEQFLFDLVPFLGLFIAVFISLFLGTEYSDGTIRNKLSVGKTRSSLYLAGYLTCLIGSLVVMAIWLCGVAIFLCTTDVPLQMGYKGLALYLLVIIGMLTTYTSLYTLTSSLSTKKATTVVICFALFLMMLIASSALYERLGEPEIQGSCIMVIDGSPVQTEPTPNPLYISGGLRVVCQTVLELLPAGQSILIANAEVTHFARLFIVSLAFTLFTTALGIGFFRKKDLK